MTAPDSPLFAELLGDVRTVLEVARSAGVNTEIVGAVVRARATLELAAAVDRHGLSNVELVDEDEPVPYRPTSFVSAPARYVFRDDLVLRDDHFQPADPHEHDWIDLSTNDDFVKNVQRRRCDRCGTYEAVELKPGALNDWIRTGRPRAESEPVIGATEDDLPPEVLARWGTCSRAEAIRQAEDAADSRDRYRENVEALQVRVAALTGLVKGLVRTHHGQLHHRAGSRIGCEVPRGAMDELADAELVVDDSRPDVVDVSVRRA